MPCPRCDDAPLDEDAYAHLLGWYLGDGHIVRHKRDVYGLAIFNDSGYPGLNSEVAETMAKVKPGGRVTWRRHPSCVETKLYWKHWPCLFPQHGPGRKHERPIVLEPWQEEIVARHPGRFLCGLFHSDGCRVTNWTEQKVAGQVKRYEYPRYFFKNASADIRQLCIAALDRLGVSWRRTDERSISVARRDSVALLDVHVGPKY